MYLNHLFKPKFLPFRIHLFKGNMNRLIFFCSMITPLLMVSMLISDFNTKLMTYSTILMVVYFLCILVGIYVTKKHLCSLTCYLVVSLIFILSTVTWLILMSFTVEEVIHFFYLYILVYMMMSIYIIIFPLIQFMITLILTLAGCYMIYQIDPDDPIFYFTIIVIGLLTILLNFTRYHQEVSIYLANNRHYEDMDLVKSLKDRDHLTNLYNNKFIFHQLNHATHLYTRYHSPLTIMFVDIDNFRNINEKYGQVFGDHIITTIANMIISSSRDTDLAARYSGKKFLIMLQNTNLNDSILFAERIRVICQQFDFETEENITLSIGLKTYDGTPLDMFIEQTLLLLREAKLNGKNNVQY